MSKQPDRLNVDKQDRKIYKEIQEKEEMFKSMKNKELFLLAMMIGFDHESPKELKSKDGFFLEKDLNDDDRAIINAVAMHDKDGVEVLKDMGEVYRIAEEYAHFGIRIIHEWINSTPHGSFTKEFESKILDKVRNITAQ